MIFKTRDVWLVALLQQKGLVLEKVEQDRGKLVFHFKKDDEAEKLINQFYVLAVDPNIQFLRQFMMRYHDVTAMIREGRESDKKLDKNEKM